MEIHAGVLPSRRFVLVALSMLIAGGAIVIALVMPKNPSSHSGEIRVVETIRTNTPSSFPDLDSDEDGLKDWEEGFWGTNPLSADTDGDGIRDGDENTISFPTQTATLQNTTGELTSTDALARDLTARYIQFRGSGEVLSAEMVADIASGYLSHLSPRARALNSYTYDDLTTTGGVTPQSLRLYGNTLGDRISTHTNGLQSELVLFADAISKQSIGDLSGLESLGKSYIALALDMRDMLIPEPLAHTHLELMNTLVYSGTDLLTMARAKDDPIVLLAAFNAYQEDAANRDAALSQLASYFVSQGIVFSETEPGYRFSL